MFLGSEVSVAHASKAKGLFARSEVSVVHASKAKGLLAPWAAIFPEKSSHNWMPG
jgi:hypothetical protein